MATGTMQVDFMVQLRIYWGQCGAVVVMPTGRGRVFEASIELVASSSDFARKFKSFLAALAAADTVDGRTNWSGGRDRFHSFTRGGRWQCIIICVQ